MGLRTWIEGRFERWFRAWFDDWIQERFDATFDARFDARLDATFDARFAAAFGAYFDALFGQRIEDWADTQLKDKFDARVDQWFDVRFAVWADTWADSAVSFQQRLDAHFDARFQERLDIEVKARVANCIEDRIDRRIQQWLIATHEAIRQAAGPDADGSSPLPEEEPAPDLAPPTAVPLSPGVTATELSAFLAKGTIGPSQIRKVLKGMERKGGRAYTYSLDEAAPALLQRRVKHGKPPGSNPAKRSGKRPGDTSEP